MAEGWRYFLAESKGLEIIGELRRARSRTLSTDNNKSGNAGFNYPLDAPYAEFIWPWSTALVVMLGDEWFWSGPIQMKTNDWESGKATISAVGWFEKVMKRLVLEYNGLTYTDEDAGTIAFQLLAYTNDISPTRVVPGTSELTQPRTRTYVRDSNIGQEIMNLADLEAGYDWYVDPVTRTLNIVARRGQPRPNCLWLAVEDGETVEYDGHTYASAGNNLSNVQEIIDGSTVVNEMWPRGANGWTGFGDDVQSQDDYDLMQEAPSLSDISDQNILNSYAQAELAYRAQPRTTYQLTPKSSGDVRVPRFKVDFDLGDTMYLTAKRGSMDIRGQGVRAFGVDLEISDSGVDKITRLQTSL